MLGLVETPEDTFSRVVAHLITCGDLYKKFFHVLVCRGSEFAWYASGPEFDLHVRHNFFVETFLRPFSFFR